MTLTGLHLLLTARCNFECDHCFVFGGPRQDGVMTLAGIRELYRQATELGTIEWIFLEGGEPFLYHPILVRAAQEAVDAGFRVGLVTNNYWATSVEDATAWLQPLAGLVDDLSLSTDLFHGDELMSASAKHAVEAAARLSIPTGTIACELPALADGDVIQSAGAPVQSGPIRFRGRAVEKLAAESPLARVPWRDFPRCPDETLDAPSRVHVDHLGNLHLCQGLVMGNYFETPLPRIVAEYRPQADPVLGPLIAGGPTALVEAHDVAHEADYLDPCHLCYETRRQLRDRFPETLCPATMYGE